MFGLKDRVSNLQYSQRFYYSNYEYYNDYDSPKEYLNDITKVFYNCKRKSIPIITKYHKLICQDEQSRKIRSNSEEELTMQIFIDSFFHTFTQNNYSDHPDIPQDKNKNSFKVHYFMGDSSIRNTKNMILRRNKWGALLDSLQIIDVLLDIQKQIRAVIMQLNQHQQISHQDLDYFRHKLVFTQLAEQTIIAQLRKKDEGTRTRYNFHIFRAMIQQILNSILDTETSSHQILYIPHISVFSYLINPALCIVKNFIIKQQSRSKSQSYSNEAFHRSIPKIAFINLEGKEHPLNLQYLRASYTQSLLYITIYKQFEQINQTNDEISVFYSKFLTRLIFQCNNDVGKQKIDQQKTNLYGPSKIIAFPLNSSYIRSKYQESQKQAQFPSLQGTSSDVLFLFQNTIYEQIRLFSPNIIFISYSNTLQIEQPYFNQIIRRLTILSDHKIILFPNLCNLFQTPNYLSQLIQESLAEQSNTQQGKFFSQESDLLNMAKFIEDYSFIQLQSINVNSFFNNLGMFNKIVSGAYSLNRQRQPKISQKFGVGAKYNYLKGLANLNQFNYIQKYCSKNFASGPLNVLLKMQRDKLLQTNKQQVQFWQHFLRKAMHKLQKNTIDLPTSLKMIYKKMALNSENRNNKIQQHFQQKKKCIIIQTINRQKLKKFYITNKNPITHNNEVIALQLYFKNKKDNKQQILLDNFSQIIIDQNNNIIFCLNYLDCRYRLYWMYGFINKQEIKVHKQAKNIQTIKVQMYILKQQDMKNRQNLYFQYSYYCDSKNKHLYLYWPYDWNCIQQAAHLLMNLKYQPKRIHSLSIISYQIQPKLVCKLQQFTYYNQSNNFVLPRYGSTMYITNQNQIYIFGGFYDSKEDFFNSTSGISILKIQGNMFDIMDIPKSVLGNKLRPKSNYKVRQIGLSQIVLEGGYGQQFTNFYNIYSYLRYRFNLQTHSLIAQKTQRHINTLSNPIRIGKYFPLSKNHRKANISGLTSKYRFIFANKQSQNKPISFVSNQYTIKTNKTTQNTITLLQLNKNLSGVYISGKYSPQLYLHHKQHSNIKRVQILTVIDQLKDWIISKQIMPSTDSIISVCLDSAGTSIYMLVYSQIYTDSGLIIYKQSLSNLFNNSVKIQASLQNNHTIELIKYYEFSSKYKNLNNKTLHCINDKLILVGGKQTNHRFRQDYVIQQNRGVAKIEQIKMEYENVDIQFNLLDFANCYVVGIPDQQRQFLLYALEMNNDYKWLLKIQHMNMRNGQQHIYVSQLTTCTILDHFVYQITPAFTKPQFTSIQRYFTTPFIKLQNCYSNLLKRLQEISLQQIQSQGLYLNDIKILKQKIGSLQDINQDIFHTRLQQIYTQLKNYADAILWKDRYQSYSQIKQQINELLGIIISLIIQNICLKFIDCPQFKQLYRFYIEDKKHNLIKYIAIGELGTNSLVFFRLKFTKPVTLCLQNFNERKQLLYGCNFLQSDLNVLCFSNEKFVRNYMKEGEETCVDIYQITPFEPQIQDYVINCEISEDR